MLKKINRDDKKLRKVVGGAVKAPIPAVPKKLDAVAAKVKRA